MSLVFLFVKSPMTKSFIQAKVEKSADGKVTFIASDESTDRYGDKLDMGMWDLKNFKKAPRLFVDHNPSVEKIVGVAKKIRVEGKQLLFEPEFHAITELARTVKAMVEEGVLDTVSVGFLWLEDKYELLEISFVGLPANTNARLQKALELQTNNKEVAQIKEFIGEDEESTLQEILTVIKELQTKTASIESLVGSKTQPVVRKQVIQARREAKLTVKSMSSLNTLLRNLLK